MKKLIILFLFAELALTVKSQQLQCTWASQIGGPNWDVVSGMTLLKDSQVVITGTFYDKISFSADTLISNGSRDIFIASYHPDGSLNKAISLGGIGYDYVKNVQPSGESGLVIPVQFNQSLQIDGKKFESGFLNNILLTWFNKNLDLTSHALISSNGKFDITSLKTTHDGDFYFSGWFTDTLITENDQLISNGVENIFMGKVSGQGKLKWIKQYKGNGRDITCSVVLEKGASYLIGSSSIGFGNSKKAPDALPSGMSHLFVSKLTNTGKEEDIEYPVYGYDVEPVDMLKDSSSLWLLVNFKYSAFLNKNEIPSRGQTDVLLIKYNPSDGSVKYCQLGGRGNEKATGLALSGDHIILTGIFTDSLTFAGQRVSAGKSSTDVFIASVSRDCQPENIISFDCENHSFAGPVTANESGIYLAGEFKGKIKAGANDLISKGKEDLFLARIENCSLRKPVEIRVRSLDDGLAINSWELDAGPGYVSYAWNDSASLSRYYTVMQTGSYLVAVTDTLGCNCVGEITISQTQLKSAKIEPDVSGESQFKLYPTITSGLVYWEPASVWGKTKAFVRIFDPAGRLIDSHEINELNSAVYQVSFSGKSEGVYLLEITGDGFHEMSKVIIKK